MDAVEMNNAAQVRTPVLERDEVLRRDKTYWFWRRVQDILLSVLGLAILWPFMLIVAVVIVIDSPGASPIFTQTRVGRDGKEFKFYKFRSMRPNAEKELDQLIPKNEMKGPVFKIKNDPRITKVGRFLRRTSIDELPQLLNVLRGDMSLIGFRSPLTYHPWPWEEYTDQQRKMFTVRPGITGWAQVNGRRTVEWNHRIELNVWYAENVSFWLDVKILFMTIGKVLGNKDNLNTEATAKSAEKVPVEK